MKTIFGNIVCSYLFVNAYPKTYIVLVLKNIHNDPYFYVRNIPQTSKYISFTILASIIWDGLNYTILIQYKHSICG